MGVEMLNDESGGLTPFCKADPARGTPGLGLGLHLVRNLIRQNRGTMDIKSGKGEGTAIIVTLPKV